MEAVIQNEMGYKLVSKTQRLPRNSVRLR